MISFTSDPAIILSQGAITCIFMAISWFLGALMFQKYYQYRDKQLFLVGLTWIFLTSPWWGDTLTFLYYITTSEVLPDSIYFFLANAFIAPIFYTWPKTVGALVLPEKTKIKKVMRSLVIIWAIIFEIAFLAIYYTDPAIIGIRIDYYMVEWIWLVNAFILSGSLFFTITGMVFSYIAIKTEKPAIQLKGKFLLVAFFVFSVSTFLEVLFVDILVMVMIARIFGIFSAFCFYMGFALPKFIRRQFNL